MKDRRKSTGTPNLFRSRMPIGGKNLSQCNGSTKVCRSSFFRPIASKISNWKAASPLFAATFLATLLTGAPAWPAAGFLVSFGAAPTSTASLSLLSGAYEPSDSSVRILYTQPPSSMGTVAFALPFSGGGTTFTSRNSASPAFIKTLYAFTVSEPVAAGCFHTKLTPSSVITISPFAFSSGAGRPAGNVGIGDPYAANSFFSLLAAA
mmetsp:Transcript_120808/g.327842  ORF Transcript_120808/g.327842 Transcript_120808/m.327842 type:complete len:207 (-) Transcript_120808:358-978(-)